MKIDYDRWLTVTVWMIAYPVTFINRNLLRQSYQYAFDILGGFVAVCCLTQVIIDSINAPFWLIAGTLSIFIGPLFEQLRSKKSQGRPESIAFNGPHKAYFYIRPAPLQCQQISPFSSTPSFK